MNNFDPIVTCVPATVDDLMTSEQHHYIDGFDYAAADAMPRSSATEQSRVEATSASRGRGEDSGISGTSGGGGVDVEADTPTSPDSVEQSVAEDT